MAEDLGKQVELQAQLNKLLRDRVALQEKLNSAAGKQVGMSQQLNSAQQKNAENQDKIAGGFKKVTQAQKKATEAQDKVSKSSGGFMDKISTTGAMALGAVSGLFKSFKSLGGILGSVGGVLGSFVGGIFKLGKSILSIPFAIFGGLVAMANNAAAAGTALRQAYEDVRKEFGAFTEGPAKNVIGAYKNLRKNAGNLADTGLRASRVFGYGAEGMAKMMGAVADLAKSLGPAMSMLGDEFKKSAGQAIMFSKGLGLSSDQMASLMKDAKLSGKSQTDMMTKVGSMSLQMAKKFGLSSKDIGRDIADMKGDFVTFGAMSTKQMAATSAYARKLGMDMKDLKGVVDKFDDFEGAAESVSQLNQAFGIQLDTMKMMNAENPAERIDMMRKAFFAAGKSIETMNRHEKKLLMTQTGLSESALKNAFAAENQGVAYDDFADASEDAEANQMSQKEVMLKLAKAMEKIAQAGQGFTGMFDALGKGFMFAITHDSKMKGLMETIRSLLRAVFQTGKIFGKFFMELVNHSGILVNLKELFNPKFLKDFNKDIKKVLDDLKEFLFTGKGSPNEIFDRFFQKIEDMFSKKGPAGKKVLGSFQRLGEIFGLLFRKVGAYIAKKMGPILEPIWDKMKAWWEEKKPIIMEHLKTALQYMFAYAIIKSVASGLVVGAIVGAFKFLGRKISKVSKVATKAQLKGGRAAAKSTGGLRGMVNGLARIGIKAIFKAALALAALGGAFAFNLWIFSVAISKSAKMFKNVKWKDIGKVFGVMAIALAASVGLIFAGQLLFGALAAIGMAAIGVAAAAGLFSIGMILYAIAIKKVMNEVGDVDFGQFVKFLGAVGLSMVATVGMVAMGVLGLIVKLSGGMLKEGLMAAAALFEVGMVRYAKAIKKIDMYFRGIDFKHFIKSLGMVGLAITATVGMVAVGVLGKLISMIDGWLTEGLESAASFFEMSMGIFVTAIIKVNKKFKKIPKSFGANLKMIGEVVRMTGIMMSLAGKSLVRKWFGSGTDSIEEAATFFVDSGPELIRMVGMIGKIKIPNPKQVKATIGIIKDIVGVMAGMSTLVEKQQRMAMVASMFGSHDPADLIEAMSGFFSTMMDKIIVTVQALVKIAQGMSKKDLDKASIVAEIIKSIADLAVAMSPALQLMQGGAISNLKSALTGSPTAEENMNIVLQGMTGIFRVLKKELPSMITVMTESLKKMKNPKEIEEKAKVFGALMKGVATAIKSIGVFQKMVQKQAKAGWFKSSDKAQKEISSMFSSIATMLAPRGSMSLMLMRLLSIIEKLKGAKDISVPDVIKMIQNVEGLVEKAMPRLIQVMGKAAKLKPISLQDHMQQYVTGITALTFAIASINNAILNNMPDIGSVEKNFKSMCLITGNLNSVFENIANVDLTSIDKGTGFWGKGVSKKDQIIASFDSIADMVNQINNTIASVGIDISAPMNALVESMTSAMKFSKKVDKAYFGKTGSVVSVVKSLVDTYNETDKALRRVANVPTKLSVRLQTFADAMGLDNQTFKIENEKLNFTINVEVVLDAEKIIDTFNDKAVMGKRTVLVRGDVKNGNIVPS